MKLFHLKCEKCPVCGPRTVAERQERQHTNGQWFETRQYKCGYTIKWVPNFSAERVSQKCPHQKDHVEMLANRQRAKKNLLRYVSKMKVDDGFKKRVEQEIDTIYIPSKAENSVFMTV
jgi:hypothetical protein